MISFTLDLAPYASQTGGKRIVTTPKGVRFFKDAKCARWEADALFLLRQFRPKAPLEGPVEADVLFVFDRPVDLKAQKHPDGLIWHTRRPDTENCFKALGDCLTRAGFWLDDSQLCSLTLRKAYAARRARASIQISIKPISE